MSRALDKDVVAALRQTDAAAAYDDISRALSAADEKELLDIEFLPRSHPVPPGTHLLRDGNALAVPKPSLVQAFVVARRVLQGHRQRHPGISDDDVLAATAVILLTDPEHTTAANTRKRLVLGAPGRGELRIAREKHLVDSLLTSRLHRHTKSPTLWNHRRWLLEQAAARGLRLDVPDDVLRVVLVSGERHPRNYYAWCHARWLVELTASPGYGRDRDVAAEREQVLSHTRAWCYRHHDDVSGWTFLSSLAFGAGAGAPPERRAAAFVEIARLAASLRWENESVWAVLRTAAASGVLGPAADAEFLAAVRALRQKSAVGSAGDQTLARAEAWFGMHSEARGGR